MEKSYYLGIIAILLALTACSGGSSNNPEPPPPSKQQGKVVLLDPTQQAQAQPITQLQYHTDGSTTADNGSFNIDEGTALTLYLGNNQTISLDAKDTINQQDMATSLCQDAVEQTACQANTQKNLVQFFLSLDNDADSSNGIQLADIADTLSLQWNVSQDQFEEALMAQLAPYGKKTAQLFSPSLGINTESAQAESDEVIQAMPFVDIFRTARPFQEFSCADVSYDTQGWPQALPASCADKSPSIIKTILLQNVAPGMIPAGRYTVLYEGEGELSYAGYGSLLERQPGRDIIELRFEHALKRLDVQISKGKVRNIRIVMPGGICADNPYIRVHNANECPPNTYQDFATTLAADRNAIIFNPDYLRVLKNFRAIRMMNLMSASPSFSACFVPDPNNPEGAPIIDQDCLLQDFTWEQRGQMDDAVWGGSYRTPRTQRYGRGIPLEVQVALANQLNVDPWFNILHNATDDYVRQFATYVRDNLKPELRAHIEYTNEAWNDNFWATLYVRNKGRGLYTASNNPFWDGAYYYAKRSTEIFKIWKDVFAGHERLVRILGTYQQNTDLTRNMLNYADTAHSVDAVAMGAYFYACWKRDSHKDCADQSKIPTTLSEATSLDDIFAAINNHEDPYGIYSLQNQFIRQAAIARSFNKRLFVYEGGQHLTIHWGDSTISTQRKNNLLDLFKAANRDPRMHEHYLTMLNAWQATKGELFMLYTLPQSFHRFGAFGIKESLNQPQNSAPKYDAAIDFQEAQRQCWWPNC